MPSHLSSIGLPIGNQSDFATLADRVGPLATPIKLEHGQYWRWSSDCGAELWLQTNKDNELVGMTPYFSGNARIKVRITARVVRENDSELDGAFHGWADPGTEDIESGAYPFVFDIADYVCYSNLEIPSIVEGQIAAFAHEVTVYQSLDSYNAAAQTGELKFASKSFIPSGLFSPSGESTVPPQAFAIFTGHVTAAAQKKNSLTDEPYYWAQVDSLGGSFDVVIDPSICETLPVVGGILSGSFWLCGRLVHHKVKPKNGLFGNLFRR